MLKQVKVDNFMKYPVFDLNSVADDIYSNINEKKIIKEQQKGKDDIAIPFKEELSLVPNKKLTICDEYGGQNLDELVDFIGENKVPEKIFGKHFQQMTKEERIYLLKVKDSILKKKRVYFAQHALDRMEERFIKEKDIIKAVRNGQIIEYRENERDKVIAIRGCTLTRDNQNVYVIMSIITGKVITTYSNKHWTTYNKQYNLDKYVKGFMINIPDYYKRRINFYHCC